MADPLPILRNTTGTFNAQVLYPFTRTISFTTTVNTFMNASEQRWPNTPPLYSFSLPMSSITATDKAAWLTFFQGQKGRFNLDLSVTIRTITYGNLTLLSDDLVVNNYSSKLYNQQIDLRQTQWYSYTPLTPGTTFPTFSFGAVAQQPFIQTASFLTSVNDSPYSPRFSYSWYDASLTNFPTTNLWSWKITFSLLSQTDMDTLELFFYTVQGRAISFSFTDPLTGTPVSHVRFDQDSLDIRYITVNQYSTSISMIQTNGS